MTKRSIELEEGQESQHSSKVARTEHREGSHAIIAEDSNINSINPFVGFEDALRRDNMPIEEFLELFKPLEQENEINPGPVERLINNGSYNTLKFLLDKGLSPNMDLHASLAGEDSIYAITPLTHAIKEEKEEIALLFIDKGASVTDEYDNDLHPISLAAATGLLKVVIALYKRGANIEEIMISDDDGSLTPLYYATEKKHIEIVKFLISVGAESYYENDEGVKISMLDIAREQRNDELTKVFSFCKLVDNIYSAPNFNITIENLDSHNNFLNHLDKSTKKVFTDRIVNFIKSKKFDNVNAIQEKLRIFENNLKLVQEDAKLDLSFLKKGGIKKLLPENKGVASFYTDDLSHESGVMKLFNLAALKLQPYIKTAQEIQSEEYKLPFITMEQVKYKASEDVAIKIQSLFDFIDKSSPDKLGYELDILGNESFSE